MTEKYFILNQIVCNDFAVPHIMQVHIWKVKCIDSQAT